MEFASWKSPGRKETFKNDISNSVSFSHKHLQVTVLFFISTVFFCQGDVIIWIADMEGSVLLQHSNHETLGLGNLADCLLCLRGSVSRQHQGEIMQFAWLQLTEVFDFVEAKHGGCHLSPPHWPMVVESSVSTECRTFCHRFPPCPSSQGELS